MKRIIFTAVLGMILVGCTTLSVPRFNEKTVKGAAEQFGMKMESSVKEFEEQMGFDLQKAYITRNYTGELLVFYLDFKDEKDAVKAYKQFYNKNVRQFTKMDDAIVMSADKADRNEATMENINDLGGFYGVCRYRDKIAVVMSDKNHVGDAKEFLEDISL